MAKERNEQLIVNDYTLLNGLQLGARNEEAMATTEQ